MNKGNKIHLVAKVKIVRFEESVFYLEHLIENIIDRIMELLFNYGFDKRVTYNENARCSSSSV